MHRPTEPRDEGRYDPKPAATKILRVEGNDNLYRLRPMVTPPGKEGQCKPRQYQDRRNPSRTQRHRRVVAVENHPEQLHVAATRTLQQDSAPQL